MATVEVLEDVLCDLRQGPCLSVLHIFPSNSVLCMSHILSLSALGKMESPLTLETAPAASPHFRQDSTSQAFSSSEADKTVLAFLSLPSYPQL